MASTSIIIIRQKVSIAERLLRGRSYQDVQEQTGAYHQEATLTILKYAVFIIATQHFNIAQQIPSDKQVPLRPTYHGQTPMVSLDWWMIIT